MQKNKAEDISLQMQKQDDDTCNNSLGDNIALDIEDNIEETIFEEDAVSPRWQPSLSHSKPSLTSRIFTFVLFLVIDSLFITFLLSTFLPSLDTSLIIANLRRNSVMTLFCLIICSLNHVSSLNGDQYCCVLFLLRILYY